MNLTSDRVVKPTTLAELQEQISMAQSNQWRVMAYGNGSKLSWGNLRKPIDLAISTHRFDRIIDHAVGDLTVTVEAGVKLNNLQSDLNKYHQFLPIDPAYADQATMGGIMATADTGTWRQLYGIRDLILGVSFIRADGETAKAGGKVVKNVAGYDLMKLFTGSFGTLGIITEITWRTYPLIDTNASVILTGDSAAIEAARKMIYNSSLTPSAFSLLSPSLVTALNLGSGYGLALRFTTMEASINHQCTQVETLTQGLGLTINPAPKHFWQQANQLVREQTIQSDTAKLKLGLPPNQIVPFFAYLDRSYPQTLALIHNRSGVGYGYLHQDKLLGPIKELRRFCQQQRGYLSVLESSDRVKQQIEPWGYHGNSLGMMERIKQQFDPDDRLNPGLFVS